MKMVLDLEKLVAECKEKLDLEMKKYKENENYSPAEFNAVIFAINRACDELEKGLKGEF